MSLRRLPVVIVLGATGAGKSRLALELAERFNGEIISADAMQMYKGLDIVTNKVTQEERERVKHHLIDCVKPERKLTVVQFRDKALPIVEDMLSRGVLPIICGGTAYYIESLIWRILIEQSNTFVSNSVAAMDDKDLVLKTSVDDEQLSIDFFSDTSNEDLHEKLRSVDPKRAEQLAPFDRRRIVRALQVYYVTGKPLSEHLAEQRSSNGGSYLGGGLRYTNSIAFWVQCDQSVLEERCDGRVDKMIQRGMLPELEQFHKDHNADLSSHADYTLGIFQSIGFKEFHEYLVLPEHEKTAEKGQKLYKEAIDQLKLVTRQYSRNQLRWIRNRFLNMRRAAPPMFTVDSTDVSKWDADCLERASSILQAYLDHEDQAEFLKMFPPLPRDVDALGGVTEEEFRKVYYCEVCEKHIPGLHAYRAHLKGHRHQHQLKRLERVEERQLIKASASRYVVQVLDLSTCTNRTQLFKTLKQNCEKGLSDIKALVDSGQVFVLPKEFAERERAEIVEKRLQKIAVNCCVKEVSDEEEVNFEGQTDDDKSDQCNGDQGQEKVRIRQPDL